MILRNPEVDDRGRSDGKDGCRSKQCIIVVAVMLRCVDDRQRGNEKVMLLSQYYPNLQLKRLKLSGKPHTYVGIIWTLAQMRLQPNDKWHANSDSVSQ